MEKQLTDLKAEVEKLAQPKDWRRTIGMFSGDEVMKQIDEEGRKIREADRQRAKRRLAKKQRVQK